MATLSGVRVKIDRAKKHLADLDVAIRAFEALEPHRVVTHKESSTGDEIYRYCSLVPIPDEWGAVVGDCVHNLRSALDLLANALVRENGGVPGDRTAFPIGSSETDFRTSAIKRIEGASATAIKIVSDLNPYRGGNEPLYRLHRIDIADKHRLLIPVAASHVVFGVQWDITGPGFEHLPPSPMARVPAVSHKFPLKDGDELGRYPRVSDPGYQDKTKFEFEFEIAFGEGQIYDGESVIPAITKLVDFTDGLVGIFAGNVFKVSW